MRWVFPEFLLDDPVRRLEDDVSVGIDHALDDRLAEPVGRLDDDDLLETGVGIEGEQDPEDARSARPIFWTVQASFTSR